MPTFANSRLPKPTSWDEFEKIVCSIAKIRWENPDFTRNGRQGQEQHGVDVYGSDKNGALIGVQCKNTVGGVSDATIVAEVADAEMFSPALSKLYIATTADSDAKTQAFVRVLSKSRRESGKFEVAILFWGDIWDELTRDESRLHQHYPQLKPAAAAAPVRPTHDQGLFERFRNELAFDPSIRLLREQDFGGPFQRAHVQPFLRFVESWDTPEHEFMDVELQAAFGKFYREAETMANCITQRTVPVGSGDMLSVFPDHQRALGPRSEHVLRDAAELNDAAGKFAPLYGEFLNLCRSKLSA